MTIHKIKSKFFVFLLLGVDIVCGSNLFVISSLRTARSFIYRSGSPISIGQDTSDIWRICPHSMPTSQCYPNVIKTDNCVALTADCRCYNWYVLETPNVKAIKNCIYVKLPLENQTTVIKWELDYTYPILPQGYETYLSLMYGRFLPDAFSLENYKSIMAPLVCEEANSQQVLQPAFDNCPFSLTLNISIGAIVNLTPVTIESIGPKILLGLSILLVSLYAFFFFEVKSRPKF